MTEVLSYGKKWTGFYKIGTSVMKEFWIEKKYDGFCLKKKLLSKFQIHLEHRKANTKRQKELNLLNKPIMGSSMAALLTRFAKNKKVH